MTHFERIPVAPPQPYPCVHLCKEANGVAWLTLDNPGKLNAMSLSMWRDLSDALRQCEADPEVRCCVLAGLGDKAFCVGADISQMDQMRSAVDASAEYDRVTKGTLAQLQAFSKPTLARVAGFCLGAGVALAIACDLRIAARGARVGIPAAKLGIGYFYAGTKLLNDLIGPAQAKRLLFTGDKFPAEEMYRIGLFDELLELEQLDARLAALSNDIANNAPLTLAAAKHAVHVACSDAVDKDTSGCDARERACVQSADHAEGRRAFLEKRSPVFKGC